MGFNSGFKGLITQ